VITPLIQRIKCSLGGEDDKCCVSGMSGYGRGNGQNIQLDTGLLKLIIKIVALCRIATYHQQNLLPLGLGEVFLRQFPGRNNLIGISQIVNDFKIYKIYPFGKKV
jgi:hypothetical protein